MLIRFIHNGSAFLPEIPAYERYFSTRGVSTETVIGNSTGKIKPDVEWYFMGTDFSGRKSGTLKIHEYTSASIPPFVYIKNTAKKILNTRPDFRLFLNNYVKNAFGFNDKVPFGYRDMGIYQGDFFADKDGALKQYDFVYCGDVSSARNLLPLLQRFENGAMRQHTILVISRNYEKLQAAFAGAGNIIFKGPFQHAEIPAMLQKARYAINFIPDREPFNKQTSSKLLEYVACRIPVITTKYEWVKNFEEQHGGTYFFLEKSLSNFTWENIRAFNFSFPEMNDWDWDKRISESGVWQFLQSKT